MKKQGRNIDPVPHPDPEKQRQRERARAHYWRNIERTREAARLRQAARRMVPEIAEKERQKSREYGRSHKAQAIARARAWAIANPEQRKAQKRSAYAREPEKWLAWGRTRRAKIAGAPGKHTAAEIRARLEEQCGLCAYCLCDLTRENCEADHVIPIARGGSNDIDNIVMACARCNNSKNDRTVIEFLQYRERRAA